MSRPQRKRPKDYVRCGVCRRLVEKRKAVKVNGRWFGSDCVSRVVAHLMNLHKTVDRRDAQED